MCKQIKLFEAFAGIGAQHKALKNIAKAQNWEIKSVGIIEWFIPAIIAYQLIHFGKPNIYKDTNPIYIYISSDSKNPISKNSYNKLLKSEINHYLIESHHKHNNSFDITKTTWQNVPKDIDIFTYSFPCQDLSIQGKQKGMSKDVNSRSSLLWQIERILLELKENYTTSEMPKYLLMENVSSVIHNNHKQEFNNWIKSLDEIGYESKLYLLNAKDFGSPQNRLRAFLLSVRKDWKQAINFEFVEFEKSKKQKYLKDILQNNESHDLFLPNLDNYERTPFRTTKSLIKRSDLINYTNFSSENYIYHPKGIGPTLTATGANSRIKILTKDNKIRMLSNLENFLYMGFDKNDYLKLKKSGLISAQKMTFLCGNSISVQVLEAIFRTLKF